MLHALQRLLHRVSAGCAYLGMGALLGALLLTVADIVLRKLGVYTWPGTLDAVQLCIMTAVFLAIPHTFLQDGHVAVDLLAERLPLRVQALLRALAALLGLGFMALVLGYGWLYAQDQIGYGDRSQTIGIPIVYYWAPLLVGAALAVLATALLLVRYGTLAVTGRDPGC